MNATGEPAIGLVVVEVIVTVGAVETLTLNSTGVDGTGARGDHSLRAS